MGLLFTSPPERCHELTEGKRIGELSVDLDHPYRLIFIPDNDPVPRRDDGGLETEPGNCDQNNRGGGHSWLIQC